MSDFYLSGRQRIKLEQVLEHATDSRVIIRAYALLWLDDGESISEVAARLTVSRQTIYNWRARFQESSSATDFILRLRDGERSGRPATATAQRIARLIDSIIDSDPRDLQYRSTVWTASLLVQYLRDEHRIKVSDDSVRRVIDRLRIRWKRPRHWLALRALNWRQAKGAKTRAVAKKPDGCVDA